MFGGGVAGFARSGGEVDGAAEGGAAIDEFELACVGEGLEISADGGFGDVHGGGKVFGGDVSPLEDLSEDAFSALGVGAHGTVVSSQ